MMKANADIQKWDKGQLQREWGVGVAGEETNERRQDRLPRVREIRWESTHLSTRSKVSKEKKERSKSASEVQVNPRCLSVKL